MAELQSDRQDHAQLPYSFAKRHGVLIKIEDDEKRTIVHLEESTALALIEAQRYLGAPAHFEPLTEDEFNILLQKTYEQGSAEAQQMMDNIGDDLDLNDIADQLPEPEDLLESADEAPIIRLINALLAEAVKEAASDIHIEPFEDKMVVRLRVDGVLRQILQPLRAMAPMVISRLKVMAKLDIAEKRLPQDGRISLRIGGRAVDVRVSTLPSIHGERIVLRLLDKQAGRLDLKQLGTRKDELTVMESLIRRPHGIILVTGPTGSGKTTTLYAALSTLNDRKRNILTVEDPIEYYLDGIGQTQVNPKVDMTFARGLRAILRQDPDIVMVGEIRDLETVEIAVQASLTGHLVLSTLHTNTAVGAITRLRDMGVEPFLLSSSIIGVLAQRLLRKLCPDCKEGYSATQAELDTLDITSEAAKTLTLYRPKGCKRCNYQGYRGRSGIFELVVIDDAMKNLIHDGAGEHELNNQARTRSRSMLQNAREKAISGETSLEEVIRVAHEN
ncbi:MAG: type II secretion system ATPase GspE [Candidatus Polarisedimenticolaceae bacterium]|nr:type II secretion system ATPase GspE [Candidatus Polarisedimenticolaceae bacterium]